MTAQTTAPAPQTSDDPTKSSYRWVMLGLLALLYGSSGIVSSSLAPLVTPILRDLDLTKSSMGVILGSWQFVYLFWAIPAGAFIDRFGLRKALLMGIGFCALSQILRASAQDYWTLMIAVAVFGLGNPFMSIGSPKLTSIWFSKADAGTALGIYSIAPSIGNMLATSTANSVVMPLTDYNWRATMLIFGVFTLMSALAWFLFARDHESSTTSASGPKETFLSASKHLISLPVIRVILVMSTCSFLFNHSFNNWLPQMLESKGMTPADAGFYSAVPTFIAVFAALFIPRKTSEKWLTHVQVLVFASWALSALLIAFTSGPLAYVGLVLLGIGRGASSPLLMLTLLRSPQVGPRLMAAAGGMYFTAGEIGGVLGPTMTGVFADKTGSFAFGLVLLATVSGIMALLSFALRAASRGVRETEAATG